MDYFKAIGERELLSIEKTQQLPPSIMTLSGSGLFERSRARKIQAVMCYLDLLQNLLPQDSTLLRPCFAHPDFHSENIFVNPDDPTVVTAVLDWSGAEIAPLLVQTSQPQIIDYEGPEPEGLQRPTKPSSFAEMSEEERRRARLLHLEQNVVALYRRQIHKQDPNIWECIVYQTTPQFLLLTIARNIFREGEGPYLAQILQLLGSRSDIVALGEPVDSASQDRLAALLNDRQGLQKYVTAAEESADVMEMVDEAIGAPQARLVAPDRYDEVKRALGQLKKEIIAKYARTEEDKIAWEKAWPFDD